MTARPLGVTLPALAATMVLALVLAACGSGGSEKATSTTDPDMAKIIEEPPGIPLPSLKRYSDLGHNHVPGNVDYPQTPPVGGDHAPAWQNCGFYSQPIVKEQGVHSIEHGAVWITYSPDLPPDQITVLRDLAKKQTYLLVSPFPALPSPVVATAWGAQVGLPAASDPGLATFVDYYREGPQTREPGAPCSGASGTPE